MAEQQIPKLYGKIILKGRIIVKTGMHIGGSSDFSAIGAVDSLVIKDSLTKLPIIPGSSLKGKMRYMLARVFSDEAMLVELKKESPKIKRLFGSAAESEDSGMLYTSRLQFSDMRMTDESKDRIVEMEPDLYVTEIKFENTINRLTSVANPRQIERVPAGSEFYFQLVYNIENLEEVKEDIENIRTAIELVEDDYIGGHGTRGYGRIRFDKLEHELKAYSDFDSTVVEDVVKQSFSY